jgi:hypothetical protein
VERLALPPEVREEAHDGDVRCLAQRIDGHALTRHHQRLVRAIVEALGERREDAHAERPHRLALAGAPLVEAVTVGQVEPLQELTAEARRRGAQGLRVGRLRALRKERAHLGEVARDRRGLERDPIPVRDDARDATGVERATDLRKAPAQGSARVVGALEEEVAEALAEVWASRRDEVSKERAGLLRRREGKGASAHGELELSKEPDPQRLVPPHHLDSSPFSVSTPAPTVAPTPGRDSALTNGGRHGNRRSEAR